MKYPGGTSDGHFSCCYVVDVVSAIVMLHGMNAMTTSCHGIHGILCMTTVNLVAGHKILQGRHLYIFKVFIEYPLLALGVF